MRADIQSQIERLESATKKIELQRKRWESQQKRMREKGGGETLEQYLPPRLLAGLLPATLLEEYDL